MAISLNLFRYKSLVRVG